MIPTFILELAQTGLSRLGESLFDLLVNRGKDVVTDRIKEVTGLDIDLDKPPTEDQRDTLKRLEVELSKALAKDLETNRHTEALVSLDNAELDSARDLQKVNIINGDMVNKHFLEFFTMFIMIMMSYFILKIMFDPVPDHMRSDATGLLEFSKNVIMTTIGFWLGRVQSRKIKRI